MENLDSFLSQMIVTWPNDSISYPLYIFNIVFFSRFICCAGFW